MAENITLRMDDELVAEIDEFVDESNLFADRSKAIRYAVRELLQHEYAGEYNE